MTIDRRQFLGSVAVLAAAVALGSLRSGRALAIADELSQVEGMAEEIANDRAKRNEASLGLLQHRASLHDVEDSRTPERAGAAAAGSRLWL